MKLLFAGSTICELATLKRLLITADEIAFMDRPSIRIEDWGTVGRESEARSFLGLFENAAVNVAVHSPPAGFHRAYVEYARADLANADFRATFLQGLRDGRNFADKFISLEGDYGSGTGREIVPAILADAQLVSAPLAGVQGGRSLFQIGDATERSQTLSVLLTEASIHVTNAMIVSAQTGLIPVTDDLFLARLLSLRSASPAYVGGVAPAAPFLAMEISRAVIPDVVLQQLDIQAILRYREGARAAYQAWSLEINKLAARLDEADPTNVARELPRILATEIEPKILEYRNEMRGIAERVFGKLLKNVALAAPAAHLSLAYLAQGSACEIVSAFLTATIGATLPALLEYATDKQNIRRKHAMGYLIDLAKKAT